jgi:hypothetical protein
MVAVHQVISGGPVAMTVEQRADYPAAQHSFEGFVFGLRLPVSHDFVALWKAANVEPFFIGRPTAKTFHVWGVSLLYALHPLVTSSEFRVSGSESRVPGLEFRRDSSFMLRLLLDFLVGALAHGY